MKFTFILTFFYLTFVFAQTTILNITTTSDVSSIESSTVEVASTTIITSTITPTTSLITNTISSSSTSNTITQTFDAGAPVQSTGFKPNGNQEANDQESWLKQHNRFVFIIFVGLIVLGLLIWYVVHSIKGMRKRLEQENAAQLYMMQQATQPYPQNRNDRVIPETLETPPPAYKTRENTPSN